jgi:MFS family permease
VPCKGFRAAAEGLPAAVAYAGRVIDGRAAGESAPGYEGWRVVAALGVVTVIAYGTTQYLFGLIVRPVAGDMGWSHAQIDGAYSWGLAVSAVAGVPIGAACDRYGARAVMAAGAAVLAASLGLLTTVTTPVGFQLVWGAGIGLGTALTYYPVSFTAVARWFRRERPRAFSRLTFIGAFSSTIFYPAAGILIARYGWREALWYLAGVNLFVALPLALAFVRSTPRAQPPNDDDERSLSVAAALRTLPFWAMTAALTLGYLASTVILAEHVAYLTGRGYPPAAVASAAGLLGIAYLPGRWLANVGARRLPLATLLAVVLFAEALGVGLLAAQRSWLGVFAYLAVFGAAYGATAPVRGGLVAHFFGPTSYGRISAIQNLPVALGAAAGPVIAGVLIDRFGYPAALTGCIAAFVAAGLLALRTR